MIYSYLYLYMLLILWSFVSSLQAQSIKIVKTSPDPSYINLGETLVLNVTYEYSGSGGVGVQWRNRNGKLLIERLRFGKYHIIDSRASIAGKATLVLNNTALYDNGTYKIRVDPQDIVDKTETFEVIIQVQPTATLNGSSTTTVQEYSDVYYSCEGENGVPTSTVSWYKGNKLEMKGKTLSLRNIKREQAGSYTCKVQSGTLKDETVLDVIVQFKPNITTFESDPKIATVDKVMAITCKADGLPEPGYIIYHDDTNLTGVVNGMKLIQSINRSHAGQYKCVANNIIGSNSGSFFLTVKETGFGWYIILVTLVCGIIVGIIVFYAVQSLCRRFKSEKDDSKPVHNYDIPETHHEGTDDNSATGVTE